LSFREDAQFLSGTDPFIVSSPEKKLQKIFVLLYFSAMADNPGRKF